MKKFKFKKIDAFATQKSEGNPAGYIRLDSAEDISAAQMLQIAKELKGFVNEVGFICRTGDGEFDLKYYSAEREVDFCGHATIAIMYDLIKNDKAMSRRGLLKIKTNKGVLDVENRIAGEDAVFIMSPVPERKTKIPGLDQIALKLGINSSEIDGALPVSIINAGLLTLIVPVKTLSSVLNISPDFDDLREFCFKCGVDIIEVFTGEVAGDGNDYRTRVFAPTFGYMEDPATGSGNSAFGYYLLDNGLWLTETVTIEQNGSMDNFNIVKLQKKMDKNGNVRVLFGGGAVTRIEGLYSIYR